MKTQGLIPLIASLLLTCTASFAAPAPAIYSAENTSRYLRTEADDAANWCCPTTLDGRWFLAGTGTLNLHNDTEFGTICTEHDLGGGGGLSFGYIYHNWRVELEGLYLRNSNDKVKLAGVDANCHGNVRHTAAMMNVYYDMALSYPFSWFVGAGIGLDRTSFSYRNAAAADINGSDTVFAWQLRTGVEYMFNNFWSVILGYRFFSTTKPDFHAMTRKDIPISNNVDLGVRIAF